ncbi:serine/threonine protein kinase [Tuwongella immobilis]|uniref:Protein kinase domain-containing protein n=1 Tax=Tuwongella immobilis TaxID=692036 RepID=A0A6C2YSR4_9BACT|nr:serine/threonine-protein kinase [Tuwongella immobilis]VIP03922.1 serine threonine protein kinase : Serine/threonine protein kinase OS=Singulisphaera acidiphila (strain ATCC BAA-1392 / DSM 18658 / VKM B-2454 / MOB10) GN=Sinac_6348 PE=3 SV=1: Pkinase [Tuwongella immobilis]VTS05211.1 serine threonine protein kinase : Serine/threonine protein kinase OS=Singulisphaera acidiphila (strain ATCC BAA-1392 / DSM 18658 / VKM B-2454 / MOB10) GN=Sinac_6348 PE=3 SV=1: Pkinase [Tuwongella immobilis]
MAASVGKFQVLGTLGTGAHSTILHIRRASDSREYALKVVNIDDEDDVKFLEQARHEFRVAKMLDHPNLIKISIAEEERTWLFRVKKIQLLIEYVRGKALDQVPLMAPTKLLVVAQKIAAGMVHMHRRGVYHADLKPNNIMMAPGGVVKIIDFGLAWIKGEEKDRVQGTPEYMAPETVKDKVVNDATEIFNFGATLYRLLTLRNSPNLLEAMETMKVNDKVWRELLKPITDFNPKVPAELANLVHQCLEYSPKRRPQSMSDVQERITQLMQELGVEDDA